MTERAWDGVPTRRMVVSTGGSISLSALNQSFATLEFEFKDVGPTVDIIVAGAIRLADIRCWGQTIYDHSTEKDKQERGVYFTDLFGADVYLDNSLPYDVVLVGAMPSGQWPGGFSKVIVTQ
jgi:hypothetical protein